MENIYKIKIKTNPDPRGQYPSERRYSASTVLGLGVLHLALTATTILLACISIMTSHHMENAGNSYNNNTDVLNNEEQENLTNGTFDTTNSNLLSIAPSLMSLGSLLAGLTALLAWKRWYIDHNIRWFFIMASLSSLTSSTCLLLTALVITSAYDFQHLSEQKKPNINFVLAINILIASIVEVMWSILSTKIAYKGMMNNYPDDIVISKSRGKVEVCTVHKGNRKAKVTPPDILNHFPMSGKISKYFPKKEISNLAKAESNQEYQERVNKFLSSNGSTDINK